MSAGVLLDEPRRRALREAKVVRAEDWWNDKVPHLIALVAIALAGSGRDIDRGLVDLGLFLVSTFGIAAFGHVVNDLADVVDDRSAGKPNQMERFSTPVGWAIALGCLVAGLLPWWALPRRGVVLALLAAEVVLLLAYSLPPLRLKRRAALGAAADALYAYVLPLLLGLMTFVPPEDLIWEVVLLLAAAGALTGLRGIIWHQVLDHEHDVASGTRTFVRRMGVRRALRCADALSPLEVVLLAILIWVGAVYADAPAVWIACAAYVPWRVFQVRYLWTSREPRRGWRSAGSISRALGFGLVLGVVERWLPLVALAVLATREPWVWWVLALHVVLFANALTEALKDLPRLPDGLARLLAEPSIHRSAVRVRQERRERIRRAPTPVRSEGAAGPRRWVFVLCGTSEHTGALRTAVRHLAPLTALEIWVVTDASRNEEPVDATGVTCVVDVATPPELDDHQAAIWLKTSVHRHLPDGEWCYLDTDLVAIDPGVDELFEHRRGPVAFATDMPFSDNTVDHFSPFALHCGCLDQGLVQCTHLREQLDERLGVRIRPDWCHWNGGVFVFTPEARELLELWHELAVGSFEWPEWRTRDQGALIAAAWRTGMQDVERIPTEFNFIVAEPWNSDVYLSAGEGWSMGPDGPWIRPRFLHLFQSGLDARGWDLNRDVEVPILRRTIQLERVAEWREALYWRTRTAIGNGARATYWAVRRRLEWVVRKSTHTARRLRPGRVRASIRRRMGRDRSERVTTP